MDVSLLLATCRRPALLRRTLAALSDLDATGPAWELVVVDNAADRPTREACAAFADRLPLRYLVQTRPGRNAALNHGLPTLRGDLVAITDDDVLPAGDWLQQLTRGAARWPGHVLFGGRILPEWPGPRPACAADAAFCGWNYGVLDPDLPEGPCPSFHPYGANMAVRRSVFREGMTFDERVGPNGPSYPMGGEIELILRLQRLGHEAVFLPGAVLRHIIRPEQMGRSWLRRRAFCQGRGLARLRGTVSWTEVARLAKRALWATAAHWGDALSPGRRDAPRKDLAASVCRGKLYEGLRMKVGRRRPGSPNGNGKKTQ